MKPKDALELGDVFRCSKIGDKAYLVVDTYYGGGGTGHGPHDIFPDGWMVKYVELPEGTLDSSLAVVTLEPHEVKGDTPKFWQSGCFNNVIEPKHITKIGSMKQSISFYWEKRIHIKQQRPI